MTLRTAEEIIEELHTMPLPERAKLRKERAERTRKRTGILLRMERLQLFRCERCRAEDEGYRCDCTAAVEIRKLGEELERLVAPVEVAEQRGGAEFSREIIDRAKRHGIDYETFYKRVVYYEWDEERAATEPKGQTGRAARIVHWTDEMTEIVEQGMKSGMSAGAIWRKHFSGMMGERSFNKKSKEIRDKALGGMQVGSKFSKRDLEQIQKMLIDGAKRRDILAAFPHISKNTVDYRIRSIREKLLEEGLL